MPVRPRVRVPGSVGRLAERLPSLRLRPSPCRPRCRHTLYHRTAMWHADDRHGDVCVNRATGAESSGADCARSLPAPLAGAEAEPRFGRARSRSPCGRGSQGRVRVGLPVAPRTPRASESGAADAPSSAPTAPPHRRAPAVRRVRRQGVAGHQPRRSVTRRACAADARPPRASRRRSTPSSRRVPASRPRRRCALRQRSSPRDVPRRTARTGPGASWSWRPTATSSRPSTGACAPASRCLPARRAAPPFTDRPGGLARGTIGPVWHPAYQPTVARPMNPLLASPCIGISRRSASIPSSRFMPPSSSIPRP